MWAIDPAFAIGLLVWAALAPPLGFVLGGLLLRQNPATAGIAREAAKGGPGPAPWPVPFARPRDSRPGSPPRQASASLPDLKLLSTSQQRHSRSRRASSPVVLNRISRRIDTRTRARIIAGAFCLVERGRIVRAAKPVRGERQLMWAAGLGSWGGTVIPHSNKAWPVHYG